GAPARDATPAGRWTGRPAGYVLHPPALPVGMPMLKLATLCSGGKTMRNLLAFTAAAALTVAGLGWYLGWYKIHSTAASDGHRNVNIDINTEKITNDIHHAEQKILERANEHLQPAKAKTDKRVENTPAGDAANCVPPR